MCQPTERREYSCRNSIMALTLPWYRSYRFFSLSISQTLSGFFRTAYPHCRAAFSEVVRMRKKSKTRSPWNPLNFFLLTFSTDTSAPYALR